MFQLAVDRTEMTNVAAAPHFDSQLAAARVAYDAELAAMKSKVIQGHSYEAYPVLFDRMTSWNSKEPLLKRIIGNGASEGGGGDVRRNPGDSGKSEDRMKARK